LNEQSNKKEGYPDESNYMHIIRAVEVLQLQEVEKPIPKKDEVLIKIHATSAHRGYTRMRGFDIPDPGWQLLLARIMLGFSKPMKYR
jgi:hypothetical protein